MQQKRKNKNMVVFSTYMALAERFNLPERKRVQLVEFLNEPLLEDFEIDKIIDHSKRIKALFEIPAMELDLAFCEDSAKIREKLRLLAN